MDYFITHYRQEVLATVVKRIFFFERELRSCCSAIFIALLVVNDTTNDK